MRKCARYGSPAVELGGSSGNHNASSSPVQHYKEESGLAGTQTPPMRAIMSLDTQDYDVLAVDVKLSDQTRCILDFTESPYVGRLLSMPQPVSLSFGTAATVRELNKIVELRRRAMSAATEHFEKTRSACGDGGKGVAARHKTVGTVTADAETITTTTTAAAADDDDDADVAQTTEEPSSCEHNALRAYVRQLSENRELFMGVVELTARLEMEQTLDILCAEFRRIYSAEVRCKFDIRLLSLQEHDSTRLRAVYDFHEAAIRAFALDAKAKASVHNPQQQQYALLPSSSSHTVAEPFVDSSKAPELARQWHRQLAKDCYFFPRRPQLGELTQSADFGISALQDKSCFDETFATALPRHPFQNPTWEPDDAAKACPVCGVVFASWSMLTFDVVRASHCRCCGRRICASCTSWQLDRSIARLSKPGGPEEGHLRRVCRECYDRVEQLNKHTFLCEVFVRAGLTVADLALLRTVNPRWRGAAELCLGDYRSSLYKRAPQGSVAARQTARVLASSADIIVGHPEPLILFLASLDWGEPTLPTAAQVTITKTAAGVAQQQDHHHHSARSGVPAWKPPISHWHLLCTRACGAMLPAFFAIRVLECLDRAPGGNLCAEKMRTIVRDKILLKKNAFLDRRVRECVVPLLLDLFDRKSCEPHATRVLLEIAAQDQRLALVIHQDTLTRSEHDSLSYHTLRELVLKVDAGNRPDTHQKFLNTIRFLSVLTAVWKNSVRPVEAADLRAAFHEQLEKAGLIADVERDEQNAAPEVSGTVTLKPMLFPFDTDVVVRSINLNGIVIVNSKQRPVLLPLIDVGGATRRILYKRENLEKDKVMCIMSRLLQWVLHKQLRQVVLPTYHVIPLSGNSGIIEIVEEGQTVQHVIERYTERRLLKYLASLGHQQPGRKQRQQQPQQQQPSHAMDNQLPTRVPTPEVRQSFLCSAKFFILMNYIFAIGDRHRDNVMIHPSGAIFHIDFGMLLTTRTLAERVTTSYVRFDLDLEECVLEFMRDREQSPPPPPHHHHHHHQEQQEEQHYHNPQRQQKQKQKQKHRNVSDASAAEAAEKPNDPLSMFLMETADWFLEVRPYASMIFQLLSHVVHRSALDGVASVDVLATLMQTIFMCDSSEATCKALFCDRVKRSRGQTWLKDFTHDTQKRTWSILSQGFRWMREKAGIDRSEL